MGILALAKLIVATMMSCFPKLGIAVILGWLRVSSTMAQS